MSREWTPQQRDAIEARGGSLLVSAAAGSGKTAILVERVIRRVLDDTPPVDIDRLLIVTFSKASAAEMRSRVGEGIRARLAQEPHNRRLLQQQMLLETAHISTIHSFCYDLIRQNFAQLGLTHDVRLADEQESTLLRRRALQEVLAESYANREENRFDLLVELVSGSRSDSELEDLLTRLYNFMRSLPFYRDWLDEKLALYDPQVPIAETVWGKIILDYASEGLEYAISLLADALGRMDEPMELAYGETFRQEKMQAEDLLALAREGNWDRLSRCLQGAEFGRLKALRGYEDEENKAYVTHCRNEARELVRRLAEKQFGLTAAQHAEDMADMAPRVKILFDTVLQLDERFSSLKRERRLLDFSDLEHMALSLLVQRRDGELEKTPLAHSLSQQLEEILVDEYQDTNSVQEMLFVTLSRGEQNLFCVGDVKQSIYRFRLAMPELFISRRAASLPYGEGFPACVVLGKNFRSRPAVTETVNYFFRMLMSLRVGEIEYNEQEALVCGASYPEEGEALCRTELHLVDVSESQTAPRAAQVEYTARYVQQLLESGMPVGSGAARRPIQPGDICILLRSMKERGPRYAEALSRRRIPCWSGADGGFLDTEEVASVLSVLQAVDNPLLDLPLAEALVSPVFGMTSDDLARIRAAAPGEPLYHAVQAAAQQGHSGCAGFLEVLSDLRRHAAWESTDRVIQRLYDQTGLLQVVRVMPMGRLRRNNLRLLVDYAGQYEKRGYRGVSGFLAFVGRLRQQGGDLASASASASDSVVISSIHSSKGLEYPVVILADLDKQFNRQDLYKGYQIHNRLGFSGRRRDPDRMIQFDTLPLIAARIEAEREQLSEEMRVLYVAMTRAKEKLVFVTAMEDPDRAVAALDLPAGPEGTVPAWTVRSRRSYFEWIAAALLQHPDGQALREPGEGRTPELVEVRRVSYCEEEEEARREEFVLSAPRMEDVEQMEQQALWRYPHLAESLTPSKFAVSSLTHGGEGEDFCLARPAFLSREGLTAAQRGNATHRFMQFADYAAAAASPEAERDRLAAEGFLTAEEAAAIHCEDITAFFASPLAKRMEKAQKVLRELRFIGELTPNSLPPTPIWARGRSRWCSTALPTVFCWKRAVPWSSTTKPTV